VEKWHIGESSNKSARINKCFKLPHTLACNSGKWCVFHIQGTNQKHWHPQRGLSETGENQSPCSYLSRLQPPLFVPSSKVTYSSTVLYTDWQKTYRNCCVLWNISCKNTVRNESTWTLWIKTLIPFFFWEDVMWNKLRTDGLLDFVHRPEI
jgi:hypothetical protein